MSGNIVKKAASDPFKVRELREIAQKYALREARSKLAEARWHSVLDASLDAILLLDEGGVIVEFNPSAEKTFGSERANAMNQFIGNFIPAIPSGLFAQWVNEGPRHRLEGTAIRKNGEVFPMEYSLAEVPVHGASKLFALFLRDVSIQKRAEQKLRKYARTLERMNDELKQFVYIASHDLQEPLRTVASFTQLLERRYKGALGNEADQFIAYIVGGSKHLQELIRSLSEYSRAGRDDFELQSTDSRSALDHAIQNLKASIDQAKARIEIGDMPAVIADPIQLTQLFQNLISNAIKFRSARPLVVKITGREEPEGWIISVKDNGIGFELKYAEQIFLIFRRLHEPGKYPGTGTGLAICKKIVARHSGKIWVDSAPEVGSTFSFLLPRDVSQVQFKSGSTS